MSTFMKSVSDLWNGSRRRQFILAIVAGVALVLFLGNSLLFSDDPNSEIPTAKVKRGDVVIKITEPGELRAEKQVTISAINDKQILWLAPEGKWVHKGDTLVVFESEKYVIARSEAEAALAVEKSRLTQALNDYQAQKAQEEAARKKLENLKKLAAQGFAVQSEVDQAQLALLEMESKTRSLRAAVDAARANVTRAERALRQQERKLRQGVILAPRDGLVVYALYGSEENAKKIEVGMVPFEGMDLMYLPDISTMLVDTEISEVDLSRVKPGQPVLIHLDAYPDTVFHGKVKKVADLAKRKFSRVTGKLTGAKVFDVTVKVLDQDVRLKPGLTATVDIIVDEYKDALYVPIEAVFIDEMDETVCYVKNGHRIETRKVILGESNDRVVVVLDGLSEGEHVLLDLPKAL
ncbi:MAG: efflux RND transporter periplasmic adaptor subunit [Calditrichaeota bacterium]|nr:MAG: efflux RND transporter periplasmic adaptor subunit [Calditrichota bacterium]